MTGAATWEKVYRLKSEDIPGAENRSPRVLVNCDVFHPKVPQGWRNGLLRLMCATPHVTWLLTTRHIRDANKIIHFTSYHLPLEVRGKQPPHQWPSNVWLGLQVSDRFELFRDVGVLAAIPAEKRFLHFKKITEKINIAGYSTQYRCADCGCSHLTALNDYECPRCGTVVTGNKATAVPAFDWVIVEARKNLSPDWVSIIHNQCEDAQVPFFFTGQHEDFECQEVPK
jgi:protein gp37